MTTTLAVAALLSMAIWLYLFFAHGWFWRSTPELPPAIPAELPDVDIIVPARDEAETIGAVIASLLAQDYAGKFRMTLVDDNSTDDTAALALAAAQANVTAASHVRATATDLASAGRDGLFPRLNIIAGQAKPAGWSGKLWAVSQGIAATRAPVLLLADADIVHDPQHLSSLVAQLVKRRTDTQPRMDMVSEMVRLNCTSLAERALVPAFVYFFQMLYPFAKVNDPRSRVAAAAGGTVLIRREALERIGGIEAIKDALIDDVTLAKAVKASGRRADGGSIVAGGSIYLGHSGLATSIRPYPGFADLWRMISRTAFTQLRYSALLLALTLLGLTLVWLVPVLEVMFAQGWRWTAGLAACALAALSYLPTLARYRCNRLWALALPLISLFYMAATLGSALNYWLGRGASWKNRAYGAER